MIRLGARKTVARVTARCFSSGAGGDGRVLSKLGKSEAVDQWEKDLEPFLTRVEGKVAETVNQLENIRPDGATWRRAFKAVKDIALSPKKHMFRPQLVLLGYAAGKGHKDLLFLNDVPEGLIEFAAGVELQHVFMFVHDDMMDHAKTRRGLDTIQVVLSRGDNQDYYSPKHNREIAVSPELVQHLTTLVGDVLQAKSMQLVFSGESEVRSGMGLASPSAVDIVVNGALRAGAAQFDDILGWPRVEHALVNTDLGGAEQLLLRLLDDKASFHSFASPLVAGLRLGSQESDVELERACSQWALHVGAAFQGLDDVMDLVLDVAYTGKDGLQDIQEGRLSLPLFLLRHKASKEEWNAVYDILVYDSLGSRLALTPSDRHFLLKLVNKYELKKLSLDFVDQQIHRAQAILKTQPLRETSLLLQRGQQVYLDGLINLSTSLRQHIK